VQHLRLKAWVSKLSISCQKKFEILDVMKSNANSFAKFDTLNQTLDRSEAAEDRKNGRGFVKDPLIKFRRSGK